MTYRINVLTDFGKSFVDKNGSFYCGTTDEQKAKAAAIIKTNPDLIINLTDVHTRTSSEFAVNGGLYPAHNLVKSDEYDLEKIGVKPGQIVSPQLTDVLLDLVKDKPKGLIIPRHVFFQDYNGEATPKPAFTFEQVAETFDIPKVKPLDQDFLNEGRLKYIVNAKHMFNGTALQATPWLGSFPGVPDEEMNVFSLLKQKFGQGAELEFDYTGVVMGICVYQAASGTRQLFPKAKINVIADACTHLVYAPLGIASEEQGNIVARAMCQQVGINYLSTDEYLGKK